MPILGIRTENKALPYEIPCTACANNLTIYHDISTTGQWFYCKSCGISGDMIELLARKLKVTLEDVIAILAAKGVLDTSVHNYDKRLNDYLARTVGLRHKLLAFWDKCKENSRNMLADHKVIAGCLNLKIGRNWDKVGSNLIGFCHKSDVERAVSVSEGKVTGGVNRPFIGEGWGEVLVIPSFDMPGRIKTLTFIGHTTEPKLAVSVRHVSYKTWGTHDKECGSVFLEEAVKSTNKSIVVMSDLINGVRLVLSHVEAHGVVPPIIIPGEDRSRSSSSWRTLVDEGRTLIAVGNRARSILTCHSAVRVGEDPGAWESSWMGSEKWIDKVITSSKPQDEPVETSPLPTKKVTHGKETYEERPDGIYHDDSLVCGALLTISKITLTGSNHFYSGTVRISGEEVPFTASTDFLDNKFSRWLKSFCIKGELDIPECSPKYAKVATRVAMLLRPPVKEIVTPANIGGRPEYEFARFNIKEGGEVTLCDRKKAIPGTEALSDQSMTLFEKGALSDDRSDLAWATIICCMANAIAKKVGCSTLGIGVTPESFDDVRFMASKMGAQINKLSGPVFNKTIIPTTLKNEEKADLPMVIDPEKIDAPLQRLNIEKASGARNCIVSMERLALLGCRTITRWAYIGESAAIISEELSSALAKLPIDFLSYATSKGFKSAGSNLIEKTVSLLSSWCNDNEIDTDGLDAGVKLIDHDLESSQNKSISDAFVSLCGKFSIMGYFTSAGYKDPGNGRVKMADMLWVECRDFFNMCKAHNVPMLEPGRLAQALKATNTIVDYCLNRDSRVPSWVIDPDKWEQWSRVL